MCQESAAQAGGAFRGRRLTGQRAGPTRARMHAPASAHAAALASRIADRSATVCVIGLGYVGLPLARIFVER